MLAVACGLVLGHAEEHAAALAGHAVLRGGPTGADRRVEPFLPIKPRRGSKKAIMAVAASILTAAYHMLKNGVDYHDLGANHVSGADKTKSVNRLLRKIEIRPYQAS
jgi:hypothetical protein